METMPERVTLPADARTLYDAIRRRDPAFEGLFFTCVRTTGIFCRPTCTARTPNRENVEFVPTAQAALLAGYRPCKVCRPLDPPSDAPEWLRELVASVRATPERAIREREIRDLGLDPDHVRRQFKRHYAMSFSAFQRALRLGGAMRTLRAGGSATAAALDAGYSSESAFRDAFTKLFGVLPSDAADAEHLTAAWMTMPLGPMLAVASDAGLCLLEFVDRRSIETQIESVRRRTGLPVVPGEHPVLTQTEQELEAYFAGELKQFTLPLSPQGTDFERAAWDRLLEIPYAEVCSYSRMARDLGRPGAARAVGRANGANRIAIIIPCHRVIRADGSLCGYGGGIDRKQWLLDHERAHAGALLTAGMKMAK
ncbi:MAG: methylated-DNA--[protein]-cysteine S-methyltransferase [Phycisphaerales bacterium]